jgi:formyltetrahydrofolate deformylase
LNLEKYIIWIDCSDEKGLVHKITGVFYHNHLNVISNHEYVDEDSNRFITRSEVEGEHLDAVRIQHGLEGILPACANIRITKKTKKNIVVMVTKEHHAIGELLLRHHYNELNANILAVVGNHETLSELVKRFDIPFHYVSHENLSRSEHEAAVIATVAPYKADYLVLAKYMRILSPQFVVAFSNTIINIHHSFLPAFIGANPYKQAYDRGVKIIGATAHFVNDMLDEGPIIFQDVLPVNHSLTWQEMAQAGRDSEKIVLAKALKLVFDDRVFVYGNKTIIFE